MWAFLEPDIWKKIKLARNFGAEHAISAKKNDSGDITHKLARDILVLPVRQHPAKKGLSLKEGQARMLHDLANIELQAMELGLRTLYEFPEAPEAFKEKLYQVVKEESDHLEMCLLEIDKLGFKWGDWPIHTALWEAVSPDDDLLDRILIVHRYLEGSGLDAGDTLIRRLQGLNSHQGPDQKSVLSAVKIINHDEISHVQFGSHWYFDLCREKKLDVEIDFTERMNKLKKIIPKRMEPLNMDLRKKAGFSDFEIAFFQKWREELVESQNRNNFYLTSK